MLFPVTSYLTIADIPAALAALCVQSGLRLLIFPKFDDEDSSYSFYLKALGSPGQIDDALAAALEAAAPWNALIDSQCSFHAKIGEADNSDIVSAALCAYVQAMQDLYPALRGHIMWSYNGNYAGDMYPDPNN